MSKRSFFLFSFVLFVGIGLPFSGYARYPLDSLRGVFYSLSPEEHEEKDHQFFRDLGAHWRYENLDSSLYYFNKYIDLAKQKDQISDVINGYRWISQSYRYHNNLNLGLESLQKALAIVNHNHLKQEAPSILGDLAGTFFNAGFNREALSYLHEQEEALQNLPDKGLILTGVYSNLAWAYIEIAPQDAANLDTARTYFQASLEQCRALDHRDGEACIFEYLGQLEQSCNNPLAAIESFRKSLATLHALNRMDYASGRGVKTGVANSRTIFIGRAHYGLAQSFLNLNQLDSAMVHCLSAEDTWSNVKIGIQDRKQALNQIILAEVYMLKGDPLVANQKIAKAKRYADKVFSNTDLLAEIHLREAQILYDQGALQTAYLSLQEHVQFTKQMELEQNNSILVTNYAEIANMAIENELVIEKQEKERAQIIRNWSMGTAIGISVLLVLILFLFYNLKRSHSLKKRYASELLNANQTKDKLMSVLGHDLRGPFQSTLGISQQAQREIENGEYNNALMSLSTISQTSREVYNLFENLLEWAKSQSGDFPFQPQDLNLFEVVEETIAICQLQAESKRLHIDANVPKQEVFADPFMLRTILRNLLSNAMKYSEWGGRIQILVDIKDNRLHLTVADEGCGMNEEERELLLSGEHSTNPTNGLGIALVHEFLQAHGSKLTLDSQSGKGSKFGFSLDNLLLSSKI